MHYVIHIMHITSPNDFQNYIIFAHGWDISHNVEMQTTKPLHLWMLKTPGTLYEPSGYNHRRDVCRVGKDYGLYGYLSILNNLLQRYNNEMEVHRSVNNRIVFPETIISFYPKGEETNYFLRIGQVRGLPPPDNVCKLSEIVSTFTEPTNLIVYTCRTPYNSQQESLLQNFYPPSVISKIKSYNI